MKTFIILILGFLYSSVALSQCNDLFVQLMRDGDQLVSKQNYEEAVKKYTAAMIICPDFANKAVEKYIEVFKKVDEMKARAEYNRRQVDEEFAKILEANKNQVKLLLTDAEEARNRMDYKKAIDIIDFASQVEAPKAQVATAYAEYIFIYGVVGNIALANELINKAYTIIEKPPKSLPLETSRTQILEKLLPIMEDLGKDLKSLSEKYLYNMVPVPSGTFDVGSFAGRGNRAYTATLSDYKIGKYEVTVEQYLLFCEAIQKSPCISKTPPWGLNQGEPMVLVSWNDAIAYCNFLSEVLGLQPVYEFGEGKLTNVYWQYNGLRLPTEAEWEYAARAGKNISKVHQSRMDHGWTVPESLNSIHPVGKRKPNDLGIHDMTGNAAEWCWDYWTREYIYTTPQTNPKGPDTGDTHVLRGGSWREESHDIVTRYKSKAADYADLMGGFRLAQTDTLLNISE